MLIQWFTQVHGITTPLAIYSNASSKCTEIYVKYPEDNFNSTCSSLAGPYRFIIKSTNIEFQSTIVKCSVNYDGTPVYYDWLINIYAPLKQFSLTPNKSVTVNQATTKNFTCSASSIPPAEFTWTIASDPPLALDIIVDLPPFRFSTLLYKADKKDNKKLLRCSAAKKESVLYGDILLDILYIPEVTVMPPFTAYKVIENTTDITLTCNVTDSNPPATTVRWFKDDNPQISSGIHFVIPTVKRFDTAIYSCEANNSVGTSNRSNGLKMDVLYGVALDTLTRRQPKEKEKLSITCNGTSYPAITDANVIWTKQENGTFIQYGKTMTINNISRLDKGVYICTVILELKPSIGEPVQVTAATTVEVDVLFPPTVRIYPEQNPLRVIENATFELSCQVVSSNPMVNVSSFKWFANGDLMNGQNSQNYTITTVNRENAGKYTCECTNTVGPSTLTEVFTLDVLFGITFTPITMQQPHDGHPLTINCNGISNPSITNMSWTKQNNNSFTAHGNSLVITNINKVDNGTYKCTATLVLKPSIGNSVIITDFTTVDVDVLYKPIVHVTPSGFNPYKAVINSTNLTFACLIQDTNPPVKSYRWFKEETLISNSAKFTISTIKMSDAGNYSCDANNSVGYSDRSLSVELDVLYGVSINAIEDRRLVEGENLNLNCTGASNPKIMDENVNWNKAEYNGSFWKGRQLLINNASRRDNGTYVCNIDISLIPSIGSPIRVSAFTTVQVNILYVPSVAIYPRQKIYNVTENDPRILLNCTIVDGNPDKVNFTWIKDGINLAVHSDVYEIDKVNRNDNGSYRCSASNSVGTSLLTEEVFLNVRYGVGLNISTRKIVMYENEPWKITCTADGNPAPTFIWTYLHNQSGIESYQNTPWKSSIDIPHANCKDSGNYNVIAANGVGNGTSKNFEIDVQCSPREEMNRHIINIYINESNFDLTATFIANPSPNITWLSTVNGTEIDGEYNATFTASVYPYKTISVLRKLNNKQLGRRTYFVKAVNTYGSFTISYNILNKVSAPYSGSGASSVLIGGLAGAAGSIVVLVAVVITVLFLVRRRQTSGVEKDQFANTNEDREENDDDYNLKDNPLYGSSNEDKIQCAKTGTKGKAMQRLKKQNKDTVYENSADFLELNSRDLYANSNENDDKSNGQNGCANYFPKKNKDGLIYADLHIDPSKKTYIIHGLENRTHYALIDLAKTADPLPSSDDESNENKEEHTDKAKDT